MAIFNSYVCLPEGVYIYTHNSMIFLYMVTGVKLSTKHNWRASPRVDVLLDLGVTILWLSRVTRLCRSEIDSHSWWVVQFFVILLVKSRISPVDV